MELRNDDAKKEMFKKCENTLCFNTNALSTLVLFPGV